MTFITADKAVPTILLQEFSAQLERDILLSGNKYIPISILHHSMKISLVSSVI